MTGDGVAIGGGFGVAGFGVAALGMAAIVGDIAGVPFNLDGNVTTVVALALTAAFCGLSYSMFMGTKHGFRVRVVHTADPQMRRLIEKIDRKDDEGPPGA